jgi:hypothetical protein
LAASAPYSPTCPAEQARRYSGFANYAQQTAGIRTIPVLELRRT